MIRKILLITGLLFVTTLSAEGQGVPPQGRRMQPPMGQMYGPMMRGRMHRHRPSRFEMAPVRQPLTEKQRKELFALREEYRGKLQRILNNP